MKSKVRGFTLVEILVVMVLIGLLSAVTVSYLGSGNLDKELVNEGNRLHAVLNMAADEAIFNNQEIGLNIDDDGYQFLVFDELAEQWTDADQTFLQSHVFPEWVTVDFIREGKKREILGSSDDAPIEGESKKPMMMFLSSAEVDPFTIGMQVAGMEYTRVEISSEGTDDIAIKLPGKE